MSISLHYFVQEGVISFFFLFKIHQLLYQNFVAVTVNFSIVFFFFPSLEQSKQTAVAIQKINISSGEFGEQLEIRKFFWIKTGFKKTLKSPLEEVIGMTGVQYFWCKNNNYLQNKNFIMHLKNRHFHFVPNSPPNVAIKRVM